MDASFDGRVITQRFTSGHCTVGGEDEDHNMEEPSAEPHEKQKHARSYDRRWEIFDKAFLVAAHGYMASAAA